MVRRPPPALALVSILLATSALAEPEPVRAPILSATLEGGLAVRNATWSTPSPPTQVVGVSPFLPRLSAEGWFLPWLGAEGELAGDLFSVRQAPGATPLFLAGGLLRGALAGRLLTPGGFLLHGSLGYAGWLSPVVQNRGDASAPSYAASTLGAHGPAARLRLGYAGERFEALAAVQARLSVSGSVNQLEVGAAAGARLVEVGPVALWAVLRGELLLERSDVSAYAGWAGRLTAGLKVALLPPRPPARLVETAPAKETALELRAELPGGAPAAGALLSLDGAAPVAVDAQGTLRLPVKPGAHEVKAVLSGYRPTTVSVQAPAAAVTTFAVRLEALSGPGALSGVVRAAASQRPLADATVTVAGLPPVRTGEDGAWRLEGVGPGPVQVRVEAQGFTTAEEVAQVPPEAAATLDVALETLGKGSPATVRGLVRARGGEALKASVLIKGSAAKVQVSPEGRFYVTVPGGTYLFIISAPGYVTQTKKVVLADGDQAILHAELQKVAQ